MMGLFWSCPECVSGFGMDAEPPVWQCKFCGHKGNIWLFVDVKANIRDLNDRMDILAARIRSIDKLMVTK